MMAYTLRTEHDTGQDLILEGDSGEGVSSDSESELKDDTGKASDGSMSGGHCDL
jgi:hypothetical protein